MFCTRCGNDADPQDRFCGSCGHSLATAAELGGETSGVWQESLDYRTVLHHPEVKALIAAAAGQKSKAMSAEELLAAVQPLLTAGGVAVPIDTVAKIARPLTERLGIRTGKEASAQFVAPPGRVLAATLCSLGSRGQALESIEQASDGCALTAILPSSIWALGGATLVVTIQAGPAATKMMAAASVPGQFFDYGHSKRVIANLFGDIPGFISLQP